MEYATDFATMWRDLSASSLGTRISGLMAMARWQTDSPAVSLFHIRSDGEHKLVHNLGYPSHILDYLAGDFAHHCDGFAQVLRRPNTPQDWDRIERFRESVSAREHFVPAGYHNGVSVVLTSEATPVGVFHFAAAQEHLDDRTFRMLDAIRPILAEYAAMIDRFSRAQLTPREVDVLTEITRGKTNAEIAATLFVSTKTIATHVERILRKLGVENRTQAALWADRFGIR